jgi:hypothetical protein
MHPRNFTTIDRIQFQKVKDPSRTSSPMRKLRHISPDGARLDRGAAMYAERAMVRLA